MTHTTLPRADSSKAGPDHRRMLQRLRSRHRRIIVASSWKVIRMINISVSLLSLCFWRLYRLFTSFTGHLSRAPSVLYECMRTLDTFQGRFHIHVTFTAAYYVIRININVGHCFLFFNLRLSPMQKFSTFIHCRTIKSYFSSFSFLNFVNEKKRKWMGARTHFRITST